MPELVIKRGDTQTPLRVQLKRGDGTFVSFAAEGITLDRIVFHIRLGSSIRSPSATAIDGDTTGECSLLMNADTVATVGTADVEVEITHPSGRRETFPVVEAFTLRIVADIAD